MLSFSECCTCQSKRMLLALWPCLLPSVSPVWHLLMEMLSKPKASD